MGGPIDQGTILKIGGQVLKKVTHNPNSKWDIKHGIGQNQAQVGVNQIKPGIQHQERHDKQGGGQKAL